MKSFWINVSLGDDDDEHGWSAIDNCDDGERQRDIGRNNKHEGDFDASGFFWRPAPEQRAHENSKIEPRGMDQVALVEVFAPAQLSAAHAAAIEDMSEATLDQLAASAQCVMPDARFQSGAVDVDRGARRLIAVPAQKAVSGLGFRDPGFPHAAVQFFQPLSRMIALVARAPCAATASASSTTRSDRDAP
jgi:hypothetical protein